MSIDDLIKTYHEFKEDGCNSEKDNLKEWAEKGQDPNILFITCIDSRVETSMFFSNYIGKMFIVKNPGNFVPLYSNLYSGIGASIEFALGFFNIKDIIICGHSNCGACETIFHKVDISESHQLRKWLTQNEDIQKQKKFTDNALEQFEKESLLQQTSNIKTYPIVQNKMKNGLKIHSWFLDMNNAMIYEYDGDDFLEL